MKITEFDNALNDAVDYAFEFYSKETDVVYCTLNKLMDNLGRELDVHEVMKMCTKLSKYLHEVHPDDYKDVAQAW